MSRPYKSDLFVGATRIPSHPCCSICRGDWCLGTRTRHCRGGSITSPLQKNRSVAKNRFLRSVHLYVTKMQETINCTLHRQPSQQRPSKLLPAAYDRDSESASKATSESSTNEQIRKEASTYVSRTCKQANFAESTSP